MFNSRSTDNRLADTLDVRYNQFDIDEDHPISTNGRHHFAQNEHCDDYEDLFEGNYEKINIEAERSVTTSDEQSEQNDDLDTTYTNEVYMSIIWHNNQMGMAYYDSDKEYIYFLADVQETSDYETLDLLLRDLRPCVTLTNSNADDVLIDHMKTVCADDFEKRFHMVPSQYFSYEACMKRILELKLPNLASMAHNERVVYLKTLLNFDSVMMIRSLGALLKYLDRNRIHVELEEQAVSTSIKKIRPITVDNILHVDENSLNALQVFHSISHPSVYKIDANREGFSLFGMFANKLRTKYGIAKLRSWLLKPTRDLDTIKQRHGLVDFFLDIDNFEYKSRLEALLKTFNKNIKQIFKRMQCKKLTVNDWNYLSKTTVSLIKLLGLLSEVRATQNKHSKVFEEFFRFDDGDYSSILNSVVQSLMKIIDFKQTNETKRVCVMDNIDFDLDRKRDIYRRLPEYLTKIAYEQLEKLNISECNIVYMPQIGFLLVIRVCNQ
jgi:DNA mismatch repair protein MSH5